MKDIDSHDFFLRGELTYLSKILILILHVAPEACMTQNLVKIPGLKYLFFWV